MDYAHNDTCAGERKTPTAQFNSPKISEKLERLRQSAFKREIPTADNETLGFLTTLVCALKPKNILELGTAVGISGIAMLSACPESTLHTVEKNKLFFDEAVENFKNFNLESRTKGILGDAGEVIEQLEGEYDFIFLDSAKVQYIKYLPRLKKLLKKGATLLADDILLYGYITGEAPVPPKRRMLVRHIREYIGAVTNDCELSTTIINIGDGLAMSVKI